MRDVSAGSRSQQETFNGLVICAHAATLTTTTTRIERGPTRLFFACADRRLIQATASSKKKKKNPSGAAESGYRDDRTQKKIKKPGA